MKRRFINFVLCSFIFLSVLSAESSTANLVLKVNESASYEIGFSSKEISTSSSPVVGLTSGAITLHGTIPEGASIDSSFEVIANNIKSDDSTHDAWVYWKLVSLTPVNIYMKVADDNINVELDQAELYATSDQNHDFGIPFKFWFDDPNNSTKYSTNEKVSIHSKNADTLQDAGSKKIYVESILSSDMLDSLKAENYTANIYVILEAGT